MSKISKPEYEAKVKLLTKEETERLLSRMSGKLPHRLQKDKLSKEQALAIQLELEDEQLQEWRKMMRKLKAKSVAKAGTKSVEKTAEKSKIASKTKAVEKAKTPAKPKVATKPKVEPGKSKAEPSK